MSEDKYASLVSDIQGRLSRLVSKRDELESKKKDIQRQIEENGALLAMMANLMRLNGIEIPE